MTFLAKRLPPKKSTGFQQKWIISKKFWRSLMFRPPIGPKEPSLGPKARLRPLVPTTCWRIIGGPRSWLGGARPLAIPRLKASFWDESICTMV